MFITVDQYQINRVGSVKEKGVVIGHIPRHALEEIAYLFASPHISTSVAMDVAYVYIREYCE